jgi:hypothetical protein
LHHLRILAVATALLAAPAVHAQSQQSQPQPQSTPRVSESPGFDQCVPNRAPQTAASRRGGRKPTVQCNLVRLDRPRRFERQPNWAEAASRIQRTNLSAK